VHKPNFGHTDSTPDNSLVNKYKDYTVKDLKKALKTLKFTNSEPDEINYQLHLYSQEQERTCSNGLRYVY
jgi:hypothetical protein